MVDAKVTWVRSIVEGPAPQCGYLVQPDFPVRMPLDGPLLPADWTAEINYLANSDGSLTMSLTDGVEVKVPVRPGLNRVFVRLPAQAMRSTSGRTPRRCRCASRRDRSDSSRRNSHTSMRL